MSHGTVPEYANRAAFSLELVHPENGESPFIVRDDEPVLHELSHQANVDQRRGASESISIHPGPGFTGQGHDHDFDLRSVDSSDSEYIMCPIQCGEAVPHREIAYHMELHDIEGTTSERLGQPNNSPGGTLLQPHTICAGVRQEASSSPHRPTVPLKPSVLARSSSKINQNRSKTPSPLGDLKGFLGGHSRRSTTSHKGMKSSVRRLGVCHCVSSDTALADWLLEIRAWPIRVRRADAKLALQATREGRESGHQH